MKTLFVYTMHTTINTSLSTETVLCKCNLSVLQETKRCTTECHLSLRNTNVTVRTTACAKQITQVKVIHLLALCQPIRKQQTGACSALITNQGLRSHFEEF